MLRVLGQVHLAQHSSGGYLARFDAFPRRYQRCQRQVANSTIRTLRYHSPDRWMATWASEAEANEELETDVAES